MASIQTSLSLQNRMTPVLQGILKSQNIVISAFEQMERASGRSLNTSSISAARVELNRVGAEFDKIEKEIDDANKKQQNLNDSVKKGGSAVDGLTSKVMGLAGAFASVAGLKKAINISDELTQTHARLNLILDDGQSLEELNARIFASAQRSRGAYMGTAQAVASLKSQAKDAFKTNDEAIQFAELLNKTFVVAGTSAQGAESVMYNLTQALGSGVLRGQDLNAVMANAPQILQYVADYMEIPMGQIRKMAEEGSLSADIIKNAMFMAAGDVEAKFSSMPMTFQQVWQSFQNEALMAFEPVLLRLNELVNNPAVQQFAANVVNALAWVGNAILWVIEQATMVGNFIAENWAIIEPMVIGIAVAFGLWKLQTMLMTAAQWLLNAAMNANPLWLIITAIVAIIVAIASWVKSVGGIRVAWLIAVNAIMVAWDWVKIAFFTGVYWVQGLLDKLSLGFMRVGAAIAGFMGDMKVAVLTILQNMINAAIDIINGFIGVINKIPGVNIGLVEQVTFATTAKIENEAAKQAREAELAAKEAEVASNKANNEANLAAMKAEAESNKNMRLAEIASIQAELAKEKEVNLGSSNAGMSQEMITAVPFDSSMIGGDSDSGKLGKIDKNTGRTADALDISNTELQYLREIAERDTVNRFTIAEISIDAKSTNNISSEMDIDGVVDRFTQTLFERVQLVAEGVHT